MRRIKDVIYHMCVDAAFAADVAPYIRPEYFDAGDGNRNETDVIAAETALEIIRSGENVTRAYLLSKIGMKNEEAAETLRRKFDELDAMEENEISHEQRVAMAQEFLRRYYTEHIAANVINVIRRMKVERDEKKLSKMRARLEKLKADMAELSTLVIEKPDVLSARDVGMRRERYKLQEEGGFFTDITDFDRALDNKPLVPKMLMILMAPPYTGKCVTKDTKILVRIKGGEPFYTTMEDLWDFALKHGRKIDGTTEKKA